MKNKRGQYYLISAMIIVVILASFISIVNFAAKSQDNSMKEIEKELNNEIEKILDYATAQNLVANGHTNIFDNMSSNYISKFSDKTTIFLYGDKANTIKVKGKNSYNETIYFNNGTGFVTLKQGTGEFSQSYSLTEDWGIIKMDEVNYTFEFQKGQSFYYLISNKDGGENNLIKG